MINKLCFEKEKNMKKNKQIILMDFSFWDYFIVEMTFILVK